MTRRLRSRPREAGTLPEGFLWGVAISAHQSEGGNTNSDCWLLERLTPTLFKEPSGAACDSYDRVADDVAIAGGLGLNCYRFGIEWARIEPAPGVFSEEALAHYEGVLDLCRANGLEAMVTYSHFTVPLWFAERGGFEVKDGADLFARFARRVTERLGSKMSYATTFNEANIPLLMRLRPQHRANATARAAMIAAAVAKTGSPRFSSLLFADARRTQRNLLDAHRKAYQAIKHVRPDLPVGLTLTMQDIQGVGPVNLAPIIRRMLYGGWLRAARTAADFIGVQTYTRARVGLLGAMPPPPGSEMTAAGYEYYPEALGNMIRFAARKTGKPIFVTESGIATDDDTRRIAFMDAGVAEVRSCIAEGIPVHSYIHWSLLDNFEWTAGYDQRFGIVGVDRTTFERLPKPSAKHLGRLARGGID